MMNRGLKTLLVAWVTVMALLWGHVAMAQTGRVASGEKRAVETSKEKAAYEGLRDYSSQQLNSVMKEAQAHIIKFDGDMTKMNNDITALESLIAQLEQGWYDEVDPQIEDHADERELNGSGVRVCNPQTQDLYFNTTTKRWDCNPTGNACMASQNVWQ